jgi:hypothetical protein
MDNTASTKETGAEALRQVVTSLEAARKELKKAKRWSYSDYILGGFVCLKIMRRCAGRADAQIVAARTAAHEYEQRKVTPGKHLPAALFDESALSVEKLPLSGIAIDLDVQDAVASLIRDLGDVIDAVKDLDKRLAGDSYE